MAIITRRGAIAAAGLAWAAMIAAPGLAQISLDDWDFGASVGGELRVFPNSPASPEQFQTFQPSLILEGDARWESEDRVWSAVIVPYARIDGQDDQRTHVDLREGYVRWTGDAFDVRAGLAKVFWGVTESRQLVDIVNQTDAVEDIDEEDKLGQPMIEIANQRDWGRLTGYILPGFRERTFPGVEGRLRTPFPVAEQDGPFRSEWRFDRLDIAGRYSHYFGDWDVAVSAFHGTSREPAIAFTPNPQGALETEYDVITQLGVELQRTTDAWLWKFEGLVREGQGDTFAAAVGGFEYTFFGVTETGADLGVLLEYQYDGRDETPDVPFTTANNDVFAGGRYTLNDIQDTAVLAGAVMDAEDGSMSALVEGERRIGSYWKGELEARLFLNVDEANLLSAFDDDDVVTIRLTRFF